MATPIVITDGGSQEHATIYNPKDDGLTGDAGLVVYTKDILPRQFTPGPLLNSDFGISLNQNAAFSGTPDRVNDGNDTTLWTLSNVTGTKASIAEDERAFGAVVTIVDYTLLSGDTVTLGVNGLDTVKTEGATWTAATSNDATATSLASDLNGISGVSAVAVAAVVNITIENGNDISNLDVSDATNSPGTAGSVLVDNPNDGDIWQFDKGSNLTVSNYTAITMKVNIDKDWTLGDSVSLYGYDTGGAVQVGLRVLLEDYVDVAVFDEWQAITIPLTAMSLTAGTIDVLRMEQESKTGKAAKFYIDNFQVEEAGTPISFRFDPNDNQLFHIERIGVFVASDGKTEAQLQAYDKFYGETTLANGVQVTIQSRGNLVVSFGENRLSDQLTQPQVTVETGGDGTNSWMKVFNTLMFDLDGRKRDFVEYTIQDDLTALDIYNVWIFGWAEPV